MFLATSNDRFIHTADRLNGMDMTLFAGYFLLFPDLCGS
jgi:hypothetical protein